MMNKKIFADARINYQSCATVTTRREKITIQ